MPERKKPGRRPKETTDQDTPRQVQNRMAQRAFRARRKQGTAGEGVRRLERAEEALRAEVAASRRRPQFIVPQSELPAFTFAGSERDSGMAATTGLQLAQSSSRRQPQAIAPQSEMRSFTLADFARDTSMNLQLAQARDQQQFTSPQSEQPVFTPANFEWDSGAAAWDRLRQLQSSSHRQSQFMGSQSDTPTFTSPQSNGDGEVDLDFGGLAMEDPFIFTPFAQNG